MRCCNFWHTFVTLSTLAPPAQENRETNLKAREQMVGSLQGSELTVTVADGKVTVNKASLQRSFLHAVIWQTS